MAGQLHVISAKEREGLKKQAKDYDFVRFAFSDVHGISRGKVVDAALFHKFVEEGVQVYVGASYFGLQGQILAFSEADKGGYANCVVVPCVAEIKPLPWAGDGKYRVGLLLCETRWLEDLSPQSMCPRYMARTQLERLEEEGYRFMSACEYEFKLEDPSTGEPVFKRPDMFVYQTFAKQETLMYDIHSMLKKVGVPIETLQTEYSPGQFELAFTPAFGIDGADIAFLFKQGVKEIAQTNGYRAVFMSKARAGIVSNSCHFNHSLWDKTTNKSVMYDAEGEHNMSAVARHWLAGLLKHAPALTALCAPTVNCYRRLHQPWAPCKPDWANEGRMVMCRLRNKGSMESHSPLSSFIENRLPGGSATSYLVLAGHIAAGLDGLKKKLPCPAPDDESAASLPHHLEEALQALEADDVMVEALGQQFVTWFCKLKRESEIKGLKDPEVRVEDETNLNAEREWYLDLA